MHFKNSYIQKSIQPIFFYQIKIEDFKIDFFKYEVDTCESLHSVLQKWASAPVLENFLEVNDPYLLSRFKWK
jgi:hypothetical protein